MLYNSLEQRGIMEMLLLSELDQKTHWNEVAHLGAFVIPLVPDELFRLLSPDPSPLQSEWFKWQ